MWNVFGQRLSSVHHHAYWSVTIWQVGHNRQNMPRLEITLNWSSWRTKDDPGETFKFPGSFGNVYGRDISPVHHHALSLTTKASAAGILHKISVILPLTRRFSQFSRLSQIGEFLSLAHVQSDYIAWNHVEYILWRKKMIFFKTLLKRPNSSLAHWEFR